MIPQPLLETRPKHNNNEGWKSSEAYNKYLEKSGKSSSQKDLFEDYDLRFDENINFVENVLEEEQFLAEDDFSEDQSSQAQPDYYCQVEKCPQQETNFQNLKSLRIHCRTSHKELVCLKCKYVSQNCTDASKHNCSKKHKCATCGRDFGTSNELQYHTFIHKGVKPHMCDFCGKWFRQRSTMDRHKLTHQSRREHECEVCHKKFKHKHYLTTHMRSHAGDKPYVCNICGQGFAQNGNMQKHIKLQHTNEKSFVCNICQKGIVIPTQSTCLNIVFSAFVQPYYLKRHLKTHKDYKEKFEDVLLVINDELDGSDKQCGIRTLSCHLCSVTCKGQEELDLHFSKHHLD